MTTPDPDSRVVRGGGWFIRVPSWLIAASRDSDEPAYRNSTFGFRTALAGRVKR